MLQSLRHTFRGLGKNPGFTAIAVLTLALGIGANTAIFSVVNSLLLRPLPLDDPSRLVAISVLNAEKNINGGAFAVRTYEMMRDGARSFTGVTASTGEGFTLPGDAKPERLAAARVAPNFLDVLGARPSIGRGFRTPEGVSGGPRVVLISQSLWRRRFGASNDIVGKPITLDQEIYSIIGVMPPNFAFPFGGIDVWVSRLADTGVFQPEQVRQGAGFLFGIARLRPGVTAEQAEAELAVIFEQFRQENPRAPGADPHNRLDVAPLQDSLVGGLRATLRVLMGAVGLVLLIACANVASLTLARATGRAREIALRTALGASRGAIVRQLLLESSLLATAGAALGALLARWGVDLLVKADAGNTLPGFQPIRVDMQALAFTLAISAIAGIAFGLAPALQVSRPDLNGILRESGWGSVGGGRRQRTRNLLVAGQMALSVVLLIGASLLVESFRNLRLVNPGFNPHNALTMNVNLPPGKYPDGPRRAQFFEDVVKRLKAIPGVRSAVASFVLPMNLRVFSPILADGQPNVPPGQRPLAIWNGATPGYFQTFGIPLLRGRDFTWADDGKAPRVAIVSQSLARRFWPNETALGKHLTFTRFQAPFEIVGVVGDTKTNGLQADAGMVMFTPYAQWTFPGMSLTIRTGADPAGFSVAAAAQVQAVDADLPVTQVLTLDAVMDQLVTQQRQTVFLIGGFAGVALLLALIGLYGLMAYSVAQRTTEIGIRQAIGARRADILRMVFGQAIRLSLMGIAAGAVAAAALTRLISGLLFRVSATDPPTFAGIALLFLAVSMLAAYVPARRATRIDPLDAMRAR
ncbi:MAG: ABC transporter permease [Bryobacteraceae bacterium]|jgi:putative ABC transport system permease protein